MQKAIDGKSAIYLNLVYNDGDIDRLPLLGMRPSHKQKFKRKISRKNK